MSYRRFLFWLVLGCTIGAPIVVAEVGLRQMGLGQPIRYGVNAAFRYAPLPDQRVERWGATVTIDHHGLRGTLPWSTSSDLHVLFVGDSITWGGTHTDDTALFSTLACAELEARLQLAVVCGNAGVNNYGIDNVVARLRHDRDVIDGADVVVVTMIAADATRGLTDLESRYFYSSPPPGPFPAIAEALGFVLYRASRYLRYHDLRYDDHHDVEIATASLDRLLEELDRLRDAGKETLLVLSATVPDLEERAPEFHRAVRRRIVEGRLPSLDLVEVVADLATAEGLDGTDLYVDDMHLTALGHRRYGAWIGAALAAQLAEGERPLVARKTSN